ncbi:MAG TPA: HD domain-containing protein [Candidatus Nanoarchaeia archaeon]|nr:HD domain-containing protein [Candidatus Nanoarchaeia archaeon]
MDSRTDRLLSFLEEIDKYKLIEREIYLKGRPQKENDAEHTWHMAMFLMLFEKDLPKDLDFLKVMKMALIHDLPEIYAGDTYAFDYEGRKTKKDREAKAAKRLYSQLPQDLSEEFTALFDEMEENKTHEAKIVKAFDHMHAVFQNSIEGGKILREKNVTKEQVDEYRKRDSHEYPIVNEIYSKLLEEIKKIIN